MTRTGYGQDGFAFIETLIAAAIIAAMVGLAFQSIATMAAQVSTIGERRRAMLVAQSQLAAVGAAVPLVPGTTAGVAGDLAWRIEVTPFASGLSDASTDLDLVTVSVARENGQPAIATLRTLKLIR